MRTFLDTNVLLYSVSTQPADQRKRANALALIGRGDCALSVQVLQEFTAQATKVNRPHWLPDDIIIDLVAGWRRFPVQPIDSALYDAAWGLRKLTNYSWWDCTIIAAAVATGCSILATEDMQHGHVIGGVRILNPFLHGG